MRKDSVWKKIALAAAISLTYGAAGCGSSAGIDSSNLSSSFPTDLALSSPTTSQASASLSPAEAGRPSYAEVSFESDESYLAKKAKIASILGASSLSSCIVALNFATTSTNANCYGPRLNYQNHPNAMSPDSNTTDDDEMGPSDNDGDGSLPGGDLGIWSDAETGSGEACVAAQTNSRVESIAGQVDTAIGMMAMLNCVAENSSLTLPGVSDSLDLTTILSDLFTSESVPFTVTGASIAREADDGDGNAVYVSSLSGTVVESMVTKTISIRLKHVPTASDNSTYKGKLSYTVSAASGTKPGNCNIAETSNGYTDGVSIAYEKASSTSLKYELNSGNFCGESANPYVSSSNYTVDATKELNSMTRTQGWANNFNYALFSMNPNDGTGTFQFAWQAGWGDSNTRTMNVKIESVDGDLGGVGYFGFGPQVQDGAGSIDSMICNWAGAGSNHTGISKVQKQTLAYDSGSAAFLPGTSNISYAPTNSCDTTGVDTGMNNFSYDVADIMDTPHTGPLTNTLVDLTDLSSNITAPSAPTEVD